MEERESSLPSEFKIDFLRSLVFNVAELLGSGEPQEILFYGWITESFLGKALERSNGDKGKSLGVVMVEQFLLEKGLGETVCVRKGNSTFDESYEAYFLTMKV